MKSYKAHVELEHNKGVRIKEVYLKSDVDKLLKNITKRYKMKAEYKNYITKENSMVEKVKNLKDKEEMKRLQDLGFLPRVKEVYKDK
jgi:hypothetical protein